jgi:hypothetical protein
MDEQSGVLAASKWSFHQLVQPGLFENLLSVSTDASKNCDANVAAGVRVPIGGKSR